MLRVVAPRRRAFDPFRRKERFGGDTSGSTAYLAAKAKGDHRLPLTRGALEDAEGAALPDPKSSKINSLSNPFRLRSRVLKLRELPARFFGGLSLEKAVMEFEREIILDALKRTNYIQTHAANLLGISRRMLKYRMDTLGIGRPDQEVSTEPPSVVQE